MVVNAAFTKHVVALAASLKMWLPREAPTALATNVQEPWRFVFLVNEHLSKPIQCRCEPSYSFLIDLANGSLFFPIWH